LKDYRVHTGPSVKITVPFGSSVTSLGKPR